MRQYKIENTEIHNKITNVIKKCGEKKVFDEIETFTYEDVLFKKQGVGFALFGLTKFTEDEIEKVNNTYKKGSKKFKLEVNKSPKYRYFYCRIWNQTKPILFFLLLNPSTTDTEHMDRTVTNCYNLAQEKGESTPKYCGFAIVNLFALRSPKPALLGKIELENDINIDFLEKLFDEKKFDIVVAWGLSDKYAIKKESILERIKAKTIYTLRKGETRHPSNQAWGRINDNEKKGFKAAKLCESNFSK